MPFKSLAQERWGNSPSGLRALGGKTGVAEWNQASKGLKLPARVGKPMAKPKGILKLKLPK